VASHGFLRAFDFKLTLLATLVFVLAIGCSISSETDPTVAAPVQPTATSASTQKTEPLAPLEELLASIEREVESIRGIDTPPAVEHHFVDQAGMQERLAEEFSDPEIIGQIENESALLKLLSVIDQDSNLTGIYESLLGSRVLGLYDPEKEQFFVLGSDELGADSLDAEAQLTYAHEYVHRLQDAKFDLEVLDELADNDDMSIAISALIEGDATAAQTQYMLANYDFAELSQLLESALAAQEELPESPYFLQRSLEFAYVEGAAFVAILTQLGKFAAVDAVFADLPKSTEQILHAEKYLDQEEPVVLDINDDALGGDWTVKTENVLGEFVFKTWLEALGSPNAGVAAAGWGGDAYAVFENGSGEFALGAAIAWDTDVDASQFFEVVNSTFEEHEDFKSMSGGLENVMTAWSTPGGYLVLLRFNSEESGDTIGIAITPSGGDSHRLIQSLVTENPS
jgi:hypothetical protein